MNDCNEFQSVNEIKPYMFEPMPNENATDIDSWGWIQTVLMLVKTKLIKNSKQ